MKSNHYIIWYLNLYSRIGKYKMWYNEYENDESTMNIDFLNLKKYGESGRGRESPPSIANWVEQKKLSLKGVGSETINRW